MQESEELFNKLKPEAEQVNPKQGMELLNYLCKIVCGEEFTSAIQKEKAETVET